MRIVRLLLLGVFGLLAGLTVVNLLGKQNVDYPANLTMLALFCLIMLVLGPWWPSQENRDRWAEKWKFQLPTDDPDVGAFVFYLVFGAFCIYRAWGAYSNPAAKLWRLEKLAHALGGVEGVISLWLLLGCMLLAQAFFTYDKVRRIQ